MFAVDTLTAATVALAVFTFLYTLFTGWILVVTRVQQAREGNPAVCARILHATTSFDEMKNVSCFTAKVEVRVLGGSPAVNVVVSGKLRLLKTEHSDE
jgi:hypothetical protein